MPEPRVLLHQAKSIEVELTWNEVNELRVIVTDHARAALADLLVAQHLGLPTRDVAERRSAAVAIEQKVTAMYLRVSEARGA